MKSKFIYLVPLLFLSFSLGFLVLSLINKDGNQDTSTKKVETNNEEITDVTEEVVEEKEIIPMTPIVPRTDARLLIFGDTALLEPLGSKVIQNPTYNPFENVMEKFKTYDYVMGNHEATIDGISVGEPNPGKPYTFSTPKESVDVFVEAGINGFSYANNHTRDYGPQSVIHTIELLRNKGIDVVGAGKNQDEAFTPLVKEINGNKIAFLAFNSAEYAYNIAGADLPGTAYFNEYKVRESIAHAKTLADIVIVMSHAGDEHVLEPNELQITWANIYTSAGADLVIGGHPHVRQRMEEFNSKKVIHSLGNFMFPGQAWNPEAQKGWAAEIIIDGKQIKEVNLLEMEMNYEGVPSWK